MAALLWLMLCPLAAILYNTYCLVTNYRKASRYGLKIIVSPVSPENSLWMGIQTLFGSSLEKLLSPASNLMYCKTGWEFSDRYRAHEKLGDAFIIVTPAWVWLYVADADAIADIFARGREFKRPVFMMEALNVFGPSVGTTEGQAWQRHRRLTAPALNESKMCTVWEESVGQAKGMLDAWLSKPQGLNTTEDDTRTLALHVLAYAAFKKSYPYASRPNNDQPWLESMTYRDSIAIILHNAILILAMPHAALSWSFMPKGLRKIGHALTYFREYMSEQIATEKALLKSNRSSTDSVVSNYVRASEESSGSIKPLTEAEMLGNIFILNFAGHDTTAYTLSYGLALLAVFPEVQDWLHEEIQHKTRPGGTYETTFPNMKRTLAILFETVRLYSPIPGMPKFVDQTTTADLTIQGKTYRLGPQTLVVPNMQAAHTKPAQWGTDSLEWRPQRWIISGADSDMSTEELFVPRPGTFFPFSDGMRSCIGKKFAQVEWVATLTTLFRDHEVEPVPALGESVEMARQRTLGVVKDSNMKLLMSMRNARNVVVRWRSRQQ